MMIGSMTPAGGIIAPPALEQEDVSLEQQQAMAESGNLAFFERLSTSIDPTCLAIAVSGGHEGLVSFFTSDHKDTFSDDHYREALQQAIAIKHAGIIKILVQCNRYTTKELLDLLFAISADPACHSCSDLIISKLKDKSPIVGDITDAHLEAAYTSGVIGLRALLDLGIEIPPDKLMSWLETAVKQKRFNFAMILLLLSRILPENKEELVTYGIDDARLVPNGKQVAGGDETVRGALVTTRDHDTPPSDLTTSRTDTFVFKHGPCYARETSLRVPPAQQKLVKRGDRTPFRDLVKQGGDIYASCFVMAVYGKEMKLLKYFKDEFVVPPIAWELAFRAALAENKEEVIDFLDQHYNDYRPRFIFNLLIDYATADDEKRVKKLVSILQKKNPQSLVENTDKQVAFLSGYDGLKALFDLNIQISGEALMSWLKQVAKVEGLQTMTALLIRHLLTKSGDSVPGQAASAEGLEPKPLEAGASPDALDTSRTMGEDEAEAPMSPVTARQFTKDAKPELAETFSEIPLDQLNLVRMGHRKGFRALRKRKINIHPGCVVLAARLGKTKLVTYFADESKIPQRIWEQAFSAALASANKEMVDLLITRHTYSARFTLNMLIECAALAEVENVGQLIPIMRGKDPQSCINITDLSVASVCHPYVLTVLKSLSVAFSDKDLLGFLQEAVTTGNETLVTWLAEKIPPATLVNLDISRARIPNLTILVPFGMSVDPSLQHRVAAGVSDDSKPFFEACLTQRIEIDPTCFLIAAQEGRFGLMFWFLDTNAIVESIHLTEFNKRQFQPEDYRTTYLRALEVVALRKEPERVAGMLSRPQPCGLATFRLDQVVEDSDPESVWKLICAGARVHARHVTCAVDARNSKMLRVLLGDLKHGDRSTDPGILAMRRILDGDPKNNIPPSYLVDHLLAAVCNGDRECVGLFTEYGVPFPFQAILEAGVRGYGDMARHLIARRYTDPQDPVLLAFSGDPRPGDYAGANAEEALFICALVGNEDGALDLVTRGTQVTAATVCVAVMMRNDHLAEKLWHLLAAQHRQQAKEAADKRAADARTTAVIDVKAQHEKIEAILASGAGPASDHPPPQTRRRTLSVAAGSIQLERGTGEGNDEDELGPDQPTNPKVAPKASEIIYYGELQELARLRQEAIEMGRVVGSRLSQESQLESGVPMGSVWIKGLPNSNSQNAAARPANASGLYTTLHELHEKFGDLLARIARVQHQIQSTKPPQKKPPFPERILLNVLIGKFSDIRELPSHHDLQFCWYIIAFFNLVDALRSLIDEAREATKLPNGTDGQAVQLIIPFAPLNVALSRGYHDLAFEMAQASASDDPDVVMLRDPTSHGISGLADVDALDALLGHSPPQETSDLPTERASLAVLRSIELAVFQGRVDAAKRQIQAAPQGDLLMSAFKGDVAQCRNAIRAGGFMSSDYRQRLLVAGVFSENRALVELLLTITQPSTDSVLVATFNSTAQDSLTLRLIQQAPLPVIHGLAIVFSLTAAEAFEPTEVDTAHPDLARRITAFPDKQKKIVAEWVKNRLPSNDEFKTPIRRPRAQPGATLSTLEAAAYTGNITQFSTLLSAKSNIPPADLEGSLLAAAQGGHLAIVRLLVGKADTPQEKMGLAVTMRGKTVPVNFACVEAAIDSGNREIIEAIVGAPSSTVIEPALLIAKGFDSSTIKSYPPNNNCMTAAAWVQNIELVNWLVEQGIPVTPHAIFRSVGPRLSRIIPPVTERLIQLAEPIDIVLASFKGDLKAVQKFMRGRPKPTPDQLAAALAAAVFIDNLPLAKLLVKGKAAVNVECLKFSQHRNPELDTYIRSVASAAVLAEFGETGIPSV